MTTFADDEYLLRIGRVAYAVAYMEWGILGDLSRLEKTLPEALKVERMTGLTMNQMAARIEQHVDAVTDPDVAAWLRGASKHFAAIAGMRNHLLHARPATIDGRQRLYRWREKDGSVEAFPITDAWLDALLVDIQKRDRAIHSLRLPL